MNREEFFEDMKEKSRVLGVCFFMEQLDNFYKYMQLLIEWNEKMNLTAITEPKEIILKHFIDSITILKEIKDGESLVDVGTGAGFPGIPLSIMKPGTTTLMTVSRPLFLIATFSCSKGISTPSFSIS